MKQIKNFLSRIFPLQLFVCVLLLTGSSAIFVLEQYHPVVFEGVAYPITIKNNGGEIHLQLSTTKHDVKETILFSINQQRIIVDFVNNHTPKYWCRVTDDHDGACVLQPKK